jgi:hypothetical protein
MERKKVAQSFMQSELVGPLAERKTGRGAVLKIEVKIFIYSFSTHLLRPTVCWELCSVLRIYQ